MSGVCFVVAVCDLVHDIKTWHMFTAYSIWNNFLNLSDAHELEI